MTHMQKVYPQGSFFLGKWAKPGLFFIYFQSVNQMIEFGKKLVNVTNVQQVSGAGIWTHNFLIVSLLLWPLDQISPVIACLETTLLNLGSGCGAVDRAAPSDTRNNFILIGYQLFPIKEEFPSDVPSVTRWLNYF